MKRKYQIFISSTFTDLKSERQACVEAVLRAGHIPAGMELFSSGNESQLEVIERWIDASDIYVLILGGRYGSIEPISGLSYTELEYNYAIKKGKPFFALIMSDNFINEKVKAEGKEILELDNPNKLKSFRTSVLSKISRFFNNETELKLAVFESINDTGERHSLTGWVKADEIPDSTKILEQISELTERNKLLEENMKLAEPSSSEKIGDFTFSEIKSALENIKVVVPEGIDSLPLGQSTNVLSLFIKFREKFAIGLNNSKLTANPTSSFLIYDVASHLRIYGLVEIVKVSNVQWSKFHTSAVGNRFLAIYFIRKKNLKP